MLWTVLGVVALLVLALVLLDNTLVTLGNRVENARAVGGALREPERQARRARS